MNPFILITIITACGMPQSAFFINTEDQSVVGIHVDSQDLETVTKARIKSDPDLELDVAKAMGLRCS